MCINWLFQYMKKYFISRMLKRVLLWFPRRRMCFPFFDLMHTATEQLVYKLGGGLAWGRVSRMTSYWDNWLLPCNNGRGGEADSVCVPLYVAVGRVLCTFGSWGSACHWHLSFLHTHRHITARDGSNLKLLLLNKLISCMDIYLLWAISMKENSRHRCHFITAILFFFF